MIVLIRGILINIAKYLESIHFLIFPWTHAGSELKDISPNNTIGKNIWDSGMDRKALIIVED